MAEMSHRKQGEYRTRIRANVLQTALGNPLGLNPLFNNLEE